MDHHSIFQLLQPHLLLSAAQTQGTTFLVIVLIILFFLSFVLSGAEVAFFSLTFKDVNLIKTKQQPAYARILQLLEDPTILLGSLLIANSFINISIIIISNLLIDDLFPFEKLQAEWLEFLIKVILVSLLLVLLGEIMPKVLATQNNIRFARDFGGIILIIYYACSRLAKFLVTYSDWIENKLAHRSRGAVSLEELDHAIDLTSELNATENEKQILKGIVKFGNITVKQIMKTRVDVNGIAENTDFVELVAQVKELRYSRLPVYQDDLDNVIGMIHTKDLLAHLHESADFRWQSLIRPPFFIHEQKFIEDLLKEFQQKRIHFAVVVDEFGGTSGIVTLEDILEEIIGDIKDEFDDEETSYKKIDDNNYLFEGKTMINDVCRIMELEKDTFDTVRGESDSLAGLVLEIAGEIPKPQQVIQSGDFEFTVLDVVKNRINKVKVTIQQQSSNN